jgi:hypothetical protein
MQKIWIHSMTGLFLIILGNGCTGTMGRIPCYHVRSGCYHTTIDDEEGLPLYVILQIDEALDWVEEGELPCEISGDITMGDAVYPLLGGAAAHTDHGQIQVEVRPEVWEEYTIRFVDVEPYAVILESTHSHPALPVPLHLAVRSDCPD